MRKQKIATTLLLSALLLSGCQSAQSDTTVSEGDVAKAETTSQVVDTAMRAIPEANAVPIHLEGSVVTANGHFFANSASAGLNDATEAEKKVVSRDEMEKEDEKEGKEETSPDKTNDSTEPSSSKTAEKPQAEEKATENVVEQQEASTASAQPKSEKTTVKQPSQPSAGTTEKKESKPASKPAVQAPVQEQKPAPKPESKPEPKPETKPAPAPVPEPEFVYTPRQAAPASKSNAVAAQIKSATPVKVQISTASTGSYYGDDGDVIVRAGWSREWWGEDAVTREEAHRAYNQITSYLNGQGYKNYGNPFDSDDTAFMNASGKRYRAYFSEFSSEFDIHVIVQ